MYFFILPILPTSYLNITEYEEPLLFFLLVTVEVLFINWFLPLQSYWHSCHWFPPAHTCFPSSPSCISHSLSRLQCKQTKNGWSLPSELKEALCVIYSVELAEIHSRNSAIQWESHTSWAMTPGASFHIKVSWMGSVWYRKWKAWSCKQAVKLKWEHTSLFYT